MSTVESVGGHCLPIQCDLRDEESVRNAFEKTIQQFGGLDVLVNNASAISLTGISTFHCFNWVFNCVLNPNRRH